MYDFSNEERAPRSLCVNCGHPVENTSGGRVLHFLENAAYSVTCWVCNCTSPEMPPEVVNILHFVPKETDPHVD
jgi:hypothetical protein